jgi:TonB family protein
MTMRARIRTAACVIAAVLAIAVVRVSAEESLATARSLYAAAAYDDALKMLDDVATRAAGDDRDTAQLYRVMCLVALGRKADADKAIQSLVTSNPRFRPAADDVSPRVLNSIRDARRRVLPAVIQQEYAASKAAFDRQAYADASRGFKSMLDALSDPDLGNAGGESPLADLRTLATGFYDLSVKAAVPPPLPTTPSMTPPAAVAAKTARPIVDMTRIYTSDDSKVVIPAVIRQDMPQFRTRISTPQKGVVELVIDETGAVASASMRVPLVGQGFNEFALSAARSWRYRPATVEGVPVKFRKVVSINLTAQ